MRRYLKSPLYLFGIFVFGLGITSLAAQEKPNIVLIVTDDQGWWDMGAHGNPDIETPALDRLAAESVEFTHFYASPVCTPTRATLMTGRHYQRTGAFDTYMGRDTLRSEEITFGEVFQKQGYRTGLFGKWHLGRYLKYHPNHQGFEAFLGFWQYGFINRYFDSDELFHNREAIDTTGYITDVLTDAAITFVRSNRHHPFLLYLPFNAPHSPYLVPDSFIEKYLKKGLPLREARIYGMITSLDENVSRLLKAVAELGLLDNTVVIFMSDNGGVSRHFKAGLRGQKGSVYEGGVRVPFLARWPGHFPAGAKVHAMAQSIDLFPTLLELIGVPLPSDRKIDGKSIVSLLRNGAGKSPHPYLFHQWNRVRPLLMPAEAQAATVGPNDRRLFGPNWAVRNARGYKLVMANTVGDSNPQLELFDLENDPGESKDIASQHPGIVGELRDQVEKWFAEVTAEQDYAPVAIEVGREDENPVELDVTWGEPVGRKVLPTYHRYIRDTVDNWTEEEDSVRWKIDVVQAGRYEVVLSYGCPPADAGSKFRVSVGSVHLEGRVESTPGREVFRPRTIGTLELAKGPASLEIKPLSIAGRELMALHKVWLERLP